jgi:hypothetical protein
MGKAFFDLSLPVAKHEASHYVASRFLGFKTGYCSIKVFFDGSHDGSSEIIFLTPSSEEMVDFIERRVQVLFAGSLGQTLNAGNVDTKFAIKWLTEQGGKFDYDKANGLIQKLCSIRYSGEADHEKIKHQFNEIFNDLWNRTTKLVVAEHQAIEALGRLLASKVNNFNEEFKIEAEEIECLPEIIELDKKRRT